MTYKQQREHAIVLGGSIGGIIAAQVLAKHFQRVSVVERDAIGELGQQRKGVPHGGQGHALLYSGLAQLERLFPGWTAELVAVGGKQVDHRAGVWAHHGIAQRRVSPGADGILASRPLIEGTLRRHLLRNPRVTFREQTDVQGLRWSGRGERVAGVSVRDRPARAQSELAADLVVDCMGRGSPLSKWLEQSLRPRVTRDEVRVDIHYASLVCEKIAPSDVLDEYVVVSPAPPSVRAGALLAMEGDRYCVTLMGMLGERVPHDDAGFRSFAELLPSPILARNLERLRGVQPIAPFSYPASRRLRYERMKGFPHGLVVFGDALTSFNPVFGQGMTVAALEGVLLDDCLSHTQGELAPRFLAAAQRIIDVPWSTAVSNDLRFPAVKGKRSISLRLIHRYMSQLYRVGAEDPTVALTLLEVINLAREPTTLLHPSIVARVLLPSLAPLWGRGDDPLHCRLRALAETNAPERWSDF